MFDITSAFGKVLKEKNGIFKVLFPLMIQVIASIIMIAIAAIMIIPIYFSESGDSIPNASVVLVPGVVIILIIVGLIYYIIWGVIASWYDYENTQAAIENRDTTPIWREKFFDFIKKSFKNLLVTFIYTLLVLIVVAAISIISALALSASFVADTSLIALLITCVICCVSIFMIIAITAYYYLIFLPAKLRLIHTHTFSEGFNFKEIWSLSKKNKSNFIILFVITFVVLIVFVAINFFMSIVTSLLQAFIPIIGIILSLILSFIYSAFYMYFMMFVLPILTGNMYRKILETENK
jgi:ABC-type sugar transport system permease subunit